jgi:hypothetical protein
MSYLRIPLTPISGLPRTISICCLAVIVHSRRPILSTLEFRLPLFTPGIDGFVAIFGGVGNGLDRSRKL